MKKTVKKALNVDLVVITLLAVLATALSLYFKANGILSSLLFFGVPSLYLSIRDPRYIKEILLFCLFWAVPASVILDILAIKNGVWYIPTSVLPRFLGILPVENLLWGVLLAYFILITYKHFFDTKLSFFSKVKLHLKTKRHVKKIQVLRILAGEVLLLGAVLMLWIVFKFRIPYFYLVANIFLVFTPIILFLTKFPNFVTRMFKLTLLLAPQFLIFELVGLHLNQWAFPSSEFIGYVEFFGLGFPIEEFVFWFLLVSSALVVWFELLIDDKK